MRPEEGLTHALLEWYARNRRDLPWRHTTDPYRIWVSEIMLQQTRVEAAIDYYERFLRAFPTVSDLANAPVDQVLKMWEGLGYYSRARNLHKAAGQIEAAGQFPDRAEAIRQLAGIGDYTAGAIASIAFGQPEAAVDGNVLRVMSRIFAIEEDVTQSRTREQIRSIVERHMPPQSMDREKGPSAFTQSLMELGALVCVPGIPRCENCPLSHICEARQRGIEQDLPVKKKKAEPRGEEYVVFLIRVEEKKDLREMPDAAAQHAPCEAEMAGNNAVLMHRRPSSGLLKGLWEYPMIEIPGWDMSGYEKNGCDAAEGFAARYGVKIRPGRYCFDAEHVFSHRIWKMHIYDAQITKEDAAKLTGSAVRKGGREESLSVDMTGDWVLADASVQEELMVPGAFRRIREYLRKQEKQ